MISDNNFLEGFTDHHIAENGKLDVPSWGRNMFIWGSSLLYNQPPEEWDQVSLSGFEKMALLNWVHQKLSEPESRKLALYYWDLNDENFLVNKEGQLKYIHLG